MFDFGLIAQMHDLDAVGAEAFVVDQPLGQDQRLGRPDRLDIDLALQAFEAVTIGIAEVLVEGDAVAIHFALPSFQLPSFQLPVASLLSGVHIRQPLAVS
jgi:hypothetical protein